MASRLADPNLIFVFFFYGLALFSMGLAILLEVRRNHTLPVARSLWLLAVFALVHGTGEWLQMLRLVADQDMPLLGARHFPAAHSAVLIFSAVFLVQFGAGLAAATRPHWALLRWANPILLLAWVLGAIFTWDAAAFLEDTHWSTLDALTRYLLYLPGSALSALALASQRPLFRKMGLPRVARDCGWAARAFALNALVAGLVVPQAPFFPATVLNYVSFTAVVGIRPPLIRALLALAIAFFIVRVLRLFEVERQREMKHMNDQLQRLSNQVLSAQESERQRIARDLHDDTAQVLSSLLVRLKLLQRVGDLQEVRSRVDELITLTGEAAEGVRRLAFELRPTALDDLGLVEALQWYVEEYATQRGIAVDFQAKGLHGRLPPPVEVGLYRIVQEALTNVSKHSGARRVRVRLEQRNGSVAVTVQDDGRGFDVEETLRSHERGLGLFGMQERAILLDGRLSVESQMDKGTTVHVEAPLAR